MPLKKYTLYFKGENKYYHEHNLPIISLELKKMDEYTSNYKNYNDLFVCLPKNIKTFILDNFNCDKNELSNNFFITDSDFNPIMDVIFEDNLDVLYIKSDELDNLIIRERMNNYEYQSILANLNVAQKAKKKYEFFKYLYYTYVKDKKISCMIDVYDASLNFPNLKEDELMIASIATQKDNIMVLCKKLGQNEEARRNLTFKFKELFNVISEDEEGILEFKKMIERKNKDLNIDDMAHEMLSKFDEFERKYKKEYEKL